MPESNQIEIILLCKGYCDVFLIAYEDYRKGMCEIDLGGIIEKGIYEGFPRPFKIVVKKSINKNLEDENCHIQIKYPDGKIYGGNGYLYSVNDDNFIVKGGINNKKS